MDIPTKLKTDYPNLLSKQTLCGPDGIKTHDTIKFDILLQSIFPGLSKFISQDTAEKLLQEINNKYNNGIASSDQSFYESHGTLYEIPISELNFYQLKVGINGPQNSTIDKPVYVVKHNDQLILCNGYHRVLTKIMSGDNLIFAYILTID